MNGTPLTAADGQPIETYDNYNLLSYARAWTGLRETDRRGNNDGHNGKPDPMKVRLNTPYPSGSDS